MQAVMSSPFNAYNAPAARPARAQFGAADGCDDNRQWGLTKTSVATGTLGFLMAYPFAHSAKKSLVAGASVAGVTAGVVALNNHAHQGKLDYSA